MRVLIVEDEALIREGILNMVNWAEEGFSEVVALENAVDALEMLDHDGADLVITDLFMPSISGFEMIEMARTMEIDTQFVILTGHGVFEYAQKAVELGVKRFLTKPIQPDDLRKLLGEMREQILENRRMEQAMTRTQEKLKEYHSVVCQQYWQLLTSENAPAEAEARQLAALYDIEPPEGELQCLAIGTADPLPFVKRAEFQQALEDLLDGRLLCVLDKGGYLLAILGADLSTGELRTFPEILHNALGVACWIGVGEARCGLGMLGQTAQEAVSALKSAVGLMEHRVSYYLDLKSVRGEEAPYPAALEERALEALRYSDDPDPDALEEFISAVYDRDAAHRRLMLLRFQVALYSLAESCGIQDMPPFQSVEAESLADAQKRFGELFGEIARRKAGMQQKAMALLVEKAKEMMKKEYSNPELSVSQIARQLYISPQYLSRLFRSIAGVTCMEYLTSVRLKAAKELLRGSSIKSYEIAEMVGYNHPNYFSALFKKHTGMTPKQFRMENEA